MIIACVGVKITKIKIENIKNIIKFESDIIVIQCRKNRIQIIGNNLKIECYSTEELTINGLINEIKFI